MLTVASYFAERDEALPATGAPLEIDVAPDLSCRIWERGGDESGSRRFLGPLSTGATALFVIAILWQSVAALVIPRCAG